MPTRADGAARSEFERAARSGTLRAPPTTTPPEPAEATLGFSSTRKTIDNSPGLSIFQQAEQTDPDYIYGTELREGVASFLGRAQYLTARDYPLKPRQTLKKRLPSTRATISPGYTLALRCIVWGPKSGTDEYSAWSDGVSNWLDYLNANFAQEFGQDWDPGGTIGAGIKNQPQHDLQQPDRLAQLSADGERLGLAIVQAEQNFRIPSTEGDS